MKATRPALARIIETIGAAGRELTPPERLLLIVIASHGGGFVHRAHPGLLELARLTGFGARSVARLVARCEAKGWLDVVRQEPHEPQRSNRYLVTPSDAAKARVEERQRERKERAAERARARQARLERDLAAELRAAE